MQFNSLLVLIFDVLIRIILETFDYRIHSYKNRKFCQLQLSVYDPFLFYNFSLL